MFHGYDGVEPGIASVKGYYAKFWAAFPDAVIDAEDCMEEDGKVALRFTVRGTHTGPLAGLAATFRPICLPGITILRFAEGKCAERWSMLDSSLLLRQLQGQTGSTPR